MNYRFALPFVSALMFVGAANAHQIWLEQTPKAAQLYFGEFGENLRETSPGLLDKFIKPTAMLVNNKNEQALTLEKTSNAFVLSSIAKNNESIVAEEVNFLPIERKNGETVTRTVRTPAARLIVSNAAQDPKLTLDIVPTGNTGEFKVFYKNQPLQKAKVGIIVQSGWMKEATSDEQGLVSFDLPWQGTYVLEVHHTDKTPGERDGKPYDIASFVTTLSMMQPEGVKALPAPSAKTPNK